MVSKAILDSLIYDYVHSNSHRLQEELVKRHNVMIASVVELIHLPMREISSLKLYKAKQYLWEELHSVHWKDVHGLDRELFGLISCILVTLLHGEPTVDQAHLLQELDCGLLLGSEHTHVLINKVMSLLRDDNTTKKLSVSVCANQRIHQLRRVQSQYRLKTLTAQNFAVKKTIKSTPMLDLGAFYSKFFQPQLPAVLLGCMEDWPAMLPNASHTRRWGSIDYLLDVLGHRTVPVETGTTYLSEDSGSRFATGEEFLRQCILGEPAAALANEILSPATSVQDESNIAAKELSFLPVGYLAQHRLLDQVPELRKDIITPDYCALLFDIDETTAQNNPLDTSCHIDNTHASSVAPGSSTEPEEHRGDDVIVNAWLGPIGTVSPLHHDPYYNLLAQTTGYKYVRLYAPEESSDLYPMAGRMSNNSELDLLLSEDELRMRFPRVTNASYEEYILGPGEMLFVPRWWWHFIVAVDRDSALLWRATHLPGQYCKDIDLDDAGSDKEKSLNQRENAKKRCISPTSAASTGNNTGNIECDVKRPRVALVLPPPLNKLTEPQYQADETGAEPIEIAATPLQDHANVQSSEGNNSVDYSFSVSFWWGKRILKS